jgi:hypothetical protein
MRVQPPTLQAVIQSLTKHTRRTVIFTKLSIVSTVFVIASLLPVAAFSGTAHADTDCSPNGIAQSGSSWLQGSGVNVCNHPGDGSHYCLAISGDPVGQNCGSGYVWSGDKWECVEMVNRLYLTLRWTNATWVGNGNTLINNVPTGLTAQNNGALSYINAGDVITLDDGGLGHAGIINNNSGTTYNIINQNAQLNSSAYISSGTLAGGNASLSMNAWAGYHVQAVIHHSSASTHHVDGFGVFRYNSSNSTYYWYVKDGRYPYGSTYTLNGVPNGSYGDVPVVGDFNGDGTDDFGVFRYNSSNSTYYWYVKDGRYPNGSTYVLNGVPNGSYGDVPVVGDFNGDGIDDFGVFRYNSTNSTYYWYVKDGRYPNGSTFVLNGVPNGSYGDVPVVGDFNGDGTDDFGVFRYDSSTSTYLWNVKDGRYPNGSTYVYNGVPNGSSGDVPVVGYFGGQ